MDVFAVSKSVRENCIKTDGRLGNGCIGKQNSKLALSSNFHADTEARGSFDVESHLPSIHPMLWNEKSA